MNRYEFDYYEKFSFFAIHALYHKLVVMIVATSLSLLAFRLAADPLAAILLLAAITLAILFESWMTWNYERYLHSKYPLNLPDNLAWGASRHLSDPDTGGRMRASYIGPSNYTTVAYTTTTVLGVSTIVAFVMGMLRLVLLLGGR